MNASAFLAFLHHLAAFTLVAALTVELVLVERNLSLGQARKIQRLMEFQLVSCWWSVSCEHFILRREVHTISITYSSLQNCHSFSSSRCSRSTLPCSICREISHSRQASRLNRRIFSSNGCASSCCGSCWALSEYFFVLPSCPEGAACSNDCQSSEGIVSSVTTLPPQFNTMCIGISFYYKKYWPTS